MKHFIKELVRRKIFNVLTLVCEHDGIVYRIMIDEAERVELPHKDVLKMASSFKRKLSDKDYLLKLKDACNFKEADFDDLVIRFQGGNAKLNHSFMLG